MKSKTRLIISIIVIMVTLGVGLRSVVIAETPTYELASSSGVWSSVVGGGSTVTGEGTSEIRWGNPTTGGQKSGLRFDGVSSQTFSEGETFTLGTLTHMNWPVYEPAATGATLHITLNFNIPDITPNPQFSFNLEVDETPNTSDESQCNPWHTPGKPPCDDMIIFPNYFGEETFKIGDKLYTLKIEGFVNSAGQTIAEFITHEREDNEVFLIGSLSSVLVAEPDITITKKTNNMDVESAPGPYLYVGEPVTWQYIVQNTGNVDLTGITVVDDQEGPASCPETTLAAGELMTCALSGTVSAGQYINTATVTGYPSGGDPVTDSDTSYHFGFDPSITLEKTADPVAFTAVNQTITYTFAVENTGDSTLTDIKITDPLTGTTNLPVTPSTLAPGEIGTATATYSTTQADFDSGQVVNTAIATAKDLNSNPVEDEDDAIVEGPKTGASINLVKEVAAVNSDPLINEFSQIGDLISYTFVVTNDGPFTLTNITLTDPDVSVSGGPIASLAPGASDNSTFTATYTITQEDIDAGEFINTATVTGLSLVGESVSDSDSATTAGPAATPAISLIKEVVKINDNPSLTNYSQAGDEITYAFTITNTGNVTLTNIVLSDPDATVTGGPIESLAPGESDSTSFSATYTVTQEDIDAGSFDNIASVTGNPSTGSSVTDTDDAIAPGPESAPSIGLIKTITEINGDSGTTVYNQVGDEITYAFTITNTGNVTLTNVTLSDPKASVEGDPIPSLAPGGVDNSTFSATYIITQSDIDAGSFSNTATVIGTPPTGDDVTDEDTESVEGPNTGAAISLIKEVAAVNGETGVDVYSQLGDTITYRFTVTNTGTFTLTNITLTDPDAIVSGGPIASLTPGASDSTTFSATHTITQADLDAGAFTNTAVVTGRAPNSSIVSDDDDANVEGPKTGGSISLIKTADPASYTQVDDQITYTFTATNDGLFTLTSVEIEDLLPGLSTLDCTPELPTTLSPGETITCTATYQVTLSDIDAGEIENTAFVTGRDPQDALVQDQDDATVQGPAHDPEISLLKTANPITYTQVGNLITYTFTVTNTGNVTLSNVVVDDPLTGSTDLPVSPSTLTPGGTGTASATYSVVQSDLDAGQILNTAVATGYSPNGEPVDDDDNVTVPGPTSEPNVMLVKTANPQAYLDVGDVIVYTFAVTNTGNVTLTNLVINDPLTGSVNLSVTPSTLAPGESGTTSATYTITQSDINAGQVLNTATVTGEDPGGNTVEDQDDATVEGPKQEPDVTLLKTANPQVFTSVGDIITYNFTVTNTGNVTLTKLVINDALTGSVNLSVVPSTLAPGESGTATATYAITQSDINTGQVLNTATVTGEDPGGNTVEDQDDETVEGPKQAPDVTLLKTANPQVFTSVGDIITYTFTVTNTGNVTLTKLVINDALTGSVNLLVVPSTLAPGESGTTSATYTITQSDINAGQVLNTATVTGEDPGGNTVEDQDDATVEGPKQSPAINLVKTANPQTYSKVGDKITYTFTVTNTGNVTLTNVVIDDPLTKSVNLAVSPSTLTPGQQGTATATYTITQADLDAGKVVNTATATGTSEGEQYSDTDTETITKETDKGLDPTPDKASGGVDINYFSFINVIYDWFCKIGFQWDGCK